ncbi:MAG: ribonuclease HI [Clostridia bacterium]|nr:ribonuclease HI [Clostridia bacterium]
MTQVQIYTDGACRGNPGPGGWGAILVCGAHERELSGGEASTTNNRMELTAAIRALDTLTRPCNVTLTSDSKYLTDAINLGWARGWQARGWKKADKSPALNADLWAELLALLDVHTVTFVWVRGHNGHPYNERCDALATAYADRFLTDQGEN